MAQGDQATRPMNFQVPEEMRTMAERSVTQSLFECAISRIYAVSAVSALSLEQALACKTGCPLLARSLGAGFRQPRRQSFSGKLLEFLTQTGSQRGLRTQITTRHIGRALARAGSEPRGHVAREPAPGPCDAKVRLTRIGSNPRGLPASRNRSIPTSLGSALSAPPLETAWYILGHLLSSRPPRSPKVIDLTGPTPPGGLVLPCSARPQPWVLPPSIRPRRRGTPSVIPRRSAGSSMWMAFACTTSSVGQVSLWCSSMATAP